MKEDRTIWRCDRCDRVQNQPLGINPSGWWWDMNIETLNASRTPKQERHFLICSDCVSLLEKWLRFGANELAERAS